MTVSIRPRLTTTTSYIDEDITELSSQVALLSSVAILTILGVIFVLAIYFCYKTFCIRQRESIIFYEAPNGRMNVSPEITQQPLLPQPIENLPAIKNSPPRLGLSAKPTNDLDSNAAEKSATSVVSRVSSTMRRPRPRRSKRVLKSRPIKPSKSNVRRQAKVKPTSDTSSQIGKEIILFKAPSFNE